MQQDRPDHEGNGDSPRPDPRINRNDKLHNKDESPGSTLENASGKSEKPEYQPGETVGRQFHIDDQGVARKSDHSKATGVSEAHNTRELGSEIFRQGSDLAAGAASDGIGASKDLGSSLSPSSPSSAPSVPTSSSGAAAPSTGGMGNGLTSPSQSNIPKSNSSPNQTPAAGLGAASQQSVPQPPSQPVSGVGSGKPDPRTQQPSSGDSPSPASGKSGVLGKMDAAGIGDMVGQDNKDEANLRREQPKSKDHRGSPEKAHDYIQGKTGVNAINVAKKVPEPITQGVARVADAEFVVHRQVVKKRRQAIAAVAVSISLIALFIAVIPGGVGAVSAAAAGVCDVPGASSSPAQNITAPDQQGGLSNQEYIWRTLRGNGFSEEATAGIMGNLEQESGMDPLADQYGKGLTDGNGYGIAQWTFNDRQQPLVAYANKNGGSYKDLEIQVGFMIKEMEDGRIDIKKMKNMNDVMEATVYFHDEFEGSLDTPEFVRNQRGGYSMKWYKKFRGTSGTVDTGTGDSDSGSGGSIADSILVYGDSLTVGVEKYLPNKVEGAKLRVNADVGRDTATGVSYFKSNDAPDIVFLALGFNPGDPQPAQFKKEATKILQSTKDSTVLWGNLHGARYQPLNEVLDQLESSYDNLSVVDLATSADKYIDSAPHLTATGYKKRAQLTVGYIKDSETSGVSDPGGSSGAAPVYGNCICPDDVPLTGGSNGEWHAPMKNMDAGGGYDWGEYSHNGHIHAGEDYNGSTGTALFALTGGTVTGIDQGLGVTAIQAKLPGGTFNYNYMHQSVIDVSVGDTVTAGQQIGEVGGAGGYPPHLHLEMWWADEPSTYSIMPTHPPIPSDVINTNEVMRAIGVKVANDDHPGGLSGATQLNPKPDYSKAHLDEIRQKLGFGSAAPLPTVGDSKECGEETSTPSGDCVEVSEEVKNEFQNYTGYSFNDMTPDAQYGMGCAEGWFPDWKLYYGTYASHYGPNGPGQPTYAVDFMVPGSCSSGPNRTNDAEDLKNGDKLASLFVEHYKEIGVRYVIWQERIRQPYNIPSDRKIVPPDQWESGGPAGDCTTAHFDHVHVTFQGSEGTYK